MGLEFPSEVIELNLDEQVEGNSRDRSQRQQGVSLTNATESDLAVFRIVEDSPNSASATPLPKAHTFTLPAHLSQACQSWDGEPIDERSLILAAFNLVLYRYTQQDQITLQVTLTNAEISQGYTTTVETLNRDDTAVRDYLRQAAIAIQEVQTRLRTQPASAPSQPPGCSVALSFVESVDSGMGRKSSATVLRQVLLNQSDALNLHLIVLRQGVDPQAILRYDSSRFQPAAIQRFAGHFQTVMNSLLKNPEQVISQVPLLLPAEVRQLLVEGRSESLPLPAMPIHHWVEQHAVERPGAIAVKFKDQSLTYQGLNQSANQLAQALMQQGVTVGDRVAVCVEPSLHIIVCILAIFKVGATYVPLDPTHPVERLAVMAEDTQPQVLLTQSHLLPTLPAIANGTICVDQATDTLKRCSSENPNLAIDLSQIAYLVYTSGTTGKPKGVMVSHSNLLNYILVAQQAFRFDAHDVMPAIARFTFSITMFELFSPLVAGGTVLILERDHILDFKRLVATLQEVTVAHLSPSLLRKLLAYIQDTPVDLQTFRGLKHLSSGGDMVSADLLETMRQVFPSAEIYVIYGSSEISCMGCFYPVPRDRKVTKSRVGKPFKNASVRLYDAHQNLVPMGIVGEVYLGGAGVTQGYLNRPELTQEKYVILDGQRFYRMGDLGRFDAEGNLELLGRADFQIKLRGIRIEPGEIEAALRQAPGIRDCVVVARELGNSERSLVAYVVPTEAAQPLAIGNIRQFLQLKLPDYMIPVGFVVLDALPVNLNQKVDRRALPEPTPANLATGNQPFVGPRDDYEERLVKIWETVLGLHPISVADNFFDVGGDSLQAVTLMLLIETVFGKTLPLSTLLTEPTIAQLAAVLKQDKPSDIHRSVVLLRPGGDKPPIFFIHDGEGETLLYRNLALRLTADHPVYGIQPYSRDGFPILHTRIEEMVAYYTAQIQRVQPQGPYFLSGLCIGGFIAFEIARNLQKMGHLVAMVALIDTADLETPLRQNLATERLSRFSQSLIDNQDLSRQQQLMTMLNVVMKKTSNLVSYELQSRMAKAQSESRMRMLRFYRDRNLPLPLFLQNISVRVALKFAEKGYVPDAPYLGEVLLFRATAKSCVFDGTEIDDTPYTDIYADPLLGWEKRVTAGVRVYDTPGGHSSMLQDPNVQFIAQEMQSYIDAAIAVYESSAHP